MGNWNVKVEGLLDAIDHNAHTMFLLVFNQRTLKSH